MTIIWVIVKEVIGDERNGSIPIVAILFTKEVMSESFKKEKTSSIAHIQNKKYIYTTRKKQIFNGKCHRLKSSFQRWVTDWQFRHKK